MSMIPGVRCHRQDELYLGPAKSDRNSRGLGVSCPFMGGMLPQTLSARFLSCVAVFGKGEFGPEVLKVYYGP